MRKSWVLLGVAALNALVGIALLVTAVIVRERSYAAGAVMFGVMAWIWLGEAALARQRSL